MKQLAFILLVVTLGSCAVCCDHASQSTAKQQKLLKAYENYYKYTEAVLDSVYSRDPDCYILDVLSETDLWQDYIDANDKVKQLSK